MLGVFAGDVIGSEWEVEPAPDPYGVGLFSGYSRFTDDSVMCASTALSVLDAKSFDFGIRSFCSLYPTLAYGKEFKSWLFSRRGPYNSWGNGAAVRAVPIGWLFNGIDAVIGQATLSASCTHNHPDGIRGATTVALAVFLARQQLDRPTMRNLLEVHSGYSLNRSMDEVRRTSVWSAASAVSVPDAICCFLQSRSFEEAVRHGLSLHADADTQCAIAGGIAEAFYGGVPEHIASGTVVRLDPRLKDALSRFQNLVVAKNNR